jgi:RNA polymerase sigma-70 factor, ECF subfamily
VELPEGAATTTIGKMPSVPSVDARLGARWALRRVDRGERALVRGAQAGSQADLEALFSLHWRRAHRAAYLIVHDASAAEDIAQEAFISAMRSLHRFDRTRPFGPWLHRIVVNRAIDHARARALRREVAEMAARAGDFGDPGADLSSELVSVLAELAPEQRAVVVLRHLLGYTPGEIADLLDLPRGTVNSRLRRGLDHLATRLETEGWER